MHHFQGRLVEGPPCFGVMESCLLGFGNGLLLLTYVYMLSMFIIYSMFYYYVNAMIIRRLTCMYSILRHPYLIWTIILCSRICLAIMFIIALITCEFT